MTKYSYNIGELMALEDVPAIWRAKTAALLQEESV